MGGRWCWPWTSTTPSRRPPPTCCRVRPARRSAPAASPHPTTATPGRLRHLAPLMPSGRDYSRINQGRQELIDHILVSRALVTPLDAVTAQALIDAPLPSI